MRLQVRGKNVEVSESIRSYAEQKLGKLGRQLNDLAEVELELAVERNPSISANQIAKATMDEGADRAGAGEASSDMRASIDRLTEKLLRQVKTKSDKRAHTGRRGATAARLEVCPWRKRREPADREDRSSS